MLVDRHPEESVRSEIGQVDAIEALRAIALAWVVLFHYLLVRAPAAADPWNAWVAAIAPLDALIRNGYLGVDLFFLITGFLLILPWARHAMEGRAAPRARDFYVRRIRRIVPAYYVQLVVLFAVMVPLFLGVAFVRANAGFVGFNAAAHALFLHYTTPITSGSLELNGALWTLTLEAEYYLLLPFLAPVFVRAPIVTAAILVALAGLWRWLTATDLAPLVSLEMALGARWSLPEATIRHLLLTQLPGYLGHFAAGMAVGLVWLRRRRAIVSDSASLGWLALLVAAAATIYWAYALGGGAHLGVEGAWLATLASLALILLALVCGGPFPARLVAATPLLFVGRVSYSGYLYHLPLVLIWNRFHILDGSALSFPLFLLTLLAVASISYHYVEAPFMRRPIIGG
jgi:peptidoglycan/LPS O-acetylase OafA/YrhL